MSLIQPTVGRKIWVFRDVGHFNNYKARPECWQPLDGNIVFVHPEGYINVAGFDSHGNHFAYLAVEIIDPEQDSLPMTAFATWMPYQLQSAKAAESTDITSETQPSDGAELIEDAVGGTITKL